MNKMMHDFRDGYGPVLAHRHPNGGGWVADTASVASTAYVGPDAQVYGNARVFGDAWVFGNARVFGDAWVYGVRRSDGYVFCYLPCADGEWRVLAGCRYFTMPEAREHWARTRSGTPLGEETFAILDALEAISRARGGGAV